MSSEGTAMTPTDSEQALRTELQTLREDLAKLQTDLRAVAQSMVESGKRQAKQTGQRLNEQMESTLDTVQDYIEERPIATVAIAFMTGMLMGRILGRG
jgi:ElaB/YqjD/DUF883 family membrane-anchored ribosome-binding protein